MKKRQYYSNSELQERTIQLIREGRPIHDLADDPKCPPEERAKLKQLRSITMKGGRHDSK